MGQSDKGPFADDFRRAVKDAVQSWRYDPGSVYHMQNGPDRDNDGSPDYTTMTSEGPVSVYYDIRFTFEIVDGKGVVSQH